MLERLARSIRSRPSRRVCRNDKARRDQHHDALAGHGRQTSHRIFQMAIDVIRSAHRPGTETDRACRLSDRLGGRLLRRISVEGALDGVFGGDAQRLRIVKILDLVGLVIVDVGTVVKSLRWLRRGRGTTPRSESFEFGVIGGELLCKLAGCRVHARRDPREPASRIDGWTPSRTNTASSINMSVSSKTTATKRCGKSSATTGGRCFARSRGVSGVPPARPHANRGFDAECRDASAACDCRGAGSLPFSNWGHAFLGDRGPRRAPARDSRGL